MRDVWDQGPTGEETAAGNGVIFDFPIDMLWKFRDAQELQHRWKALFENVATLYDFSHQLAPQHERFLREDGYLLLTNALDSLRDREEQLQEPQFEPMVRIHALRTDSRFRLEIEDNGIGLSQEAESRLFSPFNTSKIPRSRYGGQGGALHWIREKAETMGNCVCDYRNKGVGQGAVFALEVPFGRPPARRY